MPGNRAARLLFMLIVVVVLGLIARNFYRRYLNQALVKAVQARDLSAVRSLLDRGADPNYVYTYPVAGEGLQGQRSPILSIAINTLSVGGPVSAKAFPGSMGAFAVSADAAANSEEIVRLLILRGAKLDRGRYLSAACADGDAPLVKLLLEKGVDPRTPDSAGAISQAVYFANSFLNSGGLTSPARTPAEKAEVARRHEVSRQMVELLRSHGAPLTLADAKAIGDTATVQKMLTGSLPGATLDGYSALSEAARIGDLNTMRVLISRGVDPRHAPLSQANLDTGTMYQPPLYAALAGGHIDAVKLLLEHGEDPNAAASFQESPLSIAASRGELSLLKLLLDHGAKTAGVGLFSPLASALSNGKIDVVRYLLAHGVDPNAPTGHTYSALSLALRTLPQVTPDLLKHAAAVNMQVGTRGNKRVAGLATPAGTPLPIQAGPSVSNGESPPYSPLMTAIFFAPKYEPMLVKAGAKIGPDRTLICAEAARQKRLDLLLKLLTYGADINGLEMSNETALSICVDYAPSEVKVLLEHGANPNLAGRDGRTPLEKAILTGNVATVRLLLAHGADPNAHTPRGHTPLYWARRKNHPDLIALLQQAGAKE